MDKFVDVNDLQVKLLGRVYELAKNEQDKDKVNYVARIGAELVIFVAKQRDEDVARIIKCRHCKHYNMYPNKANGFCKSFGLPFYPWDFCSYGEINE